MHVPLHYSHSSLSHRKDDGCASTMKFIFCCIIYLLVLEPLVLSQPLDKTHELVVDIEPSFSQGLFYLNRLFDVVFLYEEDVDKVLNRQLVRETLEMALNSTLDSEEIAARHLSSYRENVTAITRDIDAKESQLLSHQSELDQLNLERSKWLVEMERCARDIAELNAKVRQADELTQAANSRVVKKRRNRWKWIATTVVTGGLAAPGLILNEGDIQNIKNQRAGYQARADEQRRLLQVVETNLIEIAQRQSAVEKLIKDTKESLSLVEVMLDELSSQFHVLVYFGTQIKEICTFLSQLKSELSVIHEQQKLLVLLKPLLHSLDNLILFLQTHSELTTLIGDVEILDRIRHHIVSQF